MFTPAWGDSYISTCKSAILRKHKKVPGMRQSSSVAQSSSHVVGGSLDFWLFAYFLDPIAWFLYTHLFPWKYATILDPWQRMLDCFNPDWPYLAPMIAVAHCCLWPKTQHAGGFWLEQGHISKLTYWHSNVLPPTNNPIMMRMLIFGEDILIYCWKKCLKYITSI